MSRRTVLIAVALAAAGLGTYYYYPGPGHGRPEAPRAETSTRTNGGSNLLHYAPDSPELAYIQLSAVAALPEPLLEPLNARVAYDENYTARVSSPVAGRVVRIGASPGDPMQRRQALAWLDSPEFGSALADFAKSEADLRQKESVSERARTLFDAGVLARKDLETALTDLRQAHVEHSRAQSRLANLTQGRGRTKGEEFVLRAPIAGVVAERKVNPGNEVRPDAPDPLFVLTDPAHVWVIIDLPEKYLGKVSVGQKVLIEVDAYPGRQFTGKIRYVSPALEANQRALTVEAVVANPDRELKPGLFATARIEQPQRTPAVLVPASAVQTTAGTSRVFIVNGDHVEERIVTVGQTVDSNVEISNGLKAGERVATTNVAQLSDGAKVS